MSAPLMHCIRASAGSGKTFELTRDFISLLADAKDRGETGICVRHIEDEYDWREICAITFTNRAAEEMRLRIIQRLKSIALGNEPSDRGSLPPSKAAGWIDCLLRHYGSLNVRTIDSLLQMTVRLAAMQLGLPPDFEPEFEEADIFRPLIDLLLSQTDSDGALDAIVRKACRDYACRSRNPRGLTGGSDFGDKVSALLAWMERDRYEGRDRRYATSDTVDKEYADILLRLNAAAKALVLTLDEECLTQRKHFVNFLSKCLDTCPDLRNIRESAFSKPKPLAECLLKGQTPPPEAERRYADFTDALSTALSEGRTLAMAQDYAPFVPFARRVAGLIPAYLRLVGKVPQAQMALLADMALRGSSIADIYCRMGNGLTHLLVDEFQDTSAIQWTVLRHMAGEALSRGGSLTWVGDVKQAIYGWRGGDATLFNGIMRDPVLTRLVPTTDVRTLPKNWRSCAELVRFNNGVFSRLADPATAADVISAMLPDISAARRDEEIRILTETFANAEQLPADINGREKSPGGYVVIEDDLHGTDKKDLDGKVRKRLMERMEDILRRHPPGDVAVLVRTNTQAEVAARWLTEQDVPVMTERSLRLNDHPLIRELLALLAFSDTPNDNIALWTLLSGARLLSAALAEADADPTDWLFTHPGPSPLVNCLHKVLPTVWKALRPFRTGTGATSAYDIVYDAMNGFGVWERYPDDTSSVERFLEIIHLAETRGYGSVPAFLSYWKENSGEERAPIPSNPNAVRIMTIHKAKGLEFPVVVIPWNPIDKPRTSDDPTPADLPGVGTVLLTAPEGDQHEEATSATVRETLHLSYVAWTRAKQELHVFLTSTDKVRKSKEVFRILLDGLPKTVGMPGTVPVTTAGTPQAPAAVPRRSNDWMPSPDIFRDPLGQHRELAATSGTLTHRALELLHIGTDIQADIGQSINKALEETPPSVRDLPGLRETIHDRLAWFVSLPDAVRWIRNGVPEQGLAAADGSFTRADLIVRDGDSVTVVDYKTGSPRPEHRFQIDKYRRSIMHALPHVGKVDAFLIYLDVRKCVRAGGPE